MTRGVLLVASMLCAVACGAQQITRPEWREQVAAPDGGVPDPDAAVSFTPSGPPARRYNDGAPAIPRTPLLDAVAAAVRDAAAAAGAPPPEADGRLYAAAADLAAVSQREVPARDAIELATSHHGLIEWLPELNVFEEHGEDVAGVAADVRRRLPEAFAAARPRRFGIGVAPLAGGGTTVVVALQPVALETDPIPRQLAAGASFDLAGKVLPPYGAPTVYVTAQDGKVATFTPRLAAGSRFHQTLSCGDRPGELQVEIGANDAAGSPSVLANFAVWCGVAPPASVALRPREALPADVATAERTILELANRDRVAAGVRPLEWSERAAQVARAHSEDMREHHFVAHVSPRSGSLEDRARRAGLAAPLLAENLARSTTPTEAHRGLMASPGHRANLLNPQVTHMGVGVAVDEDASGTSLYVTQVFVRAIPRLELAAARRQIAAALDQQRRAAGQPPVVEDPLLTGIASRYAEGLAAHQPDGKLGDAADAACREHADRWLSVGTVIGVTADPADVAQKTDLPPDARVYGVGVAQGSHPELGEGALYVVILFATLR